MTWPYFREQTVVVAQVVGEDFVEAADEWETLRPLGTLKCLAIDAKTNRGGWRCGENLIDCGDFLVAITDVETQTY